MQIEGFEISNEPTLMGMWLGSHSEKLRIITCGFVSTTHNPMRTAESIATMDHNISTRSIKIDAAGEGAAGGHTEDGEETK